MAESGIPEYATVAELHDLTGTSKKTIYKHIEKANLKANGKKYQVQSVLSAIVKHRQEDNDTTRLRKDADGLQWRERKLKAEALMAEMELDEMRQTLIKVEKVEGYLGKLFTAMKQHILGMPTKVAPMLLAEETVEGVELVLQGEAQDICNLIADYEISDEPDDGYGDHSESDTEMPNEGTTSTEADGI